MLTYRIKVYLLLFFAIFFAKILFAQVVTTNPAFITKDFTGPFEIIFDASQGSGNLKDYLTKNPTGTVYAHIGVITNLSTSNSDWKHAPSKWGDNAPKYKCNYIENNKWKLTISPDLKGYFGLNASEVVKKIAMVFRSGEFFPSGGSSYVEGKETGGTDIFVTVVESGLNMAFTSPTTNQTVAVGTTINFSINASQLVNTLQLYLNGTLVKTANAVSSLNYAHTFTAANDYLFVAEAIDGSANVKDTVRVSVPKPVVDQARPAGTKNGINYLTNNSVCLVLHAPGKSNVFLLGEMNDWTQLNAYQLKRDGEYWWITLENLTPAKIYAYQYLVDGALKISDPFTEMVLDPWNDSWINQKYQRYPNLKPYPAGKTEGLVATFQTDQTPYVWTDNNFEMKPHENAVIYEVLLRDFTDEKSLEAAIAKLDYLKELGVSAIELMPIQEFDGNESWGYNPNHFFATDKAYGNKNMYKKFVDECHKRGMGVIVDVVFNHATGQFPYAKLWWDGAANKTASSNPYFNVDAPHPYSVFHDFNHNYQPTREYFKQVLQYWLNEFKIDGYRLDLTKGFSQRQVSESNASSYDQSRIDILTEYYNAAKLAKPNVMFILEHFCDNAEETALANKGMYLWRNVNNAFSQAAMGYQSESSFGGLVTTPRNWVGFGESHDEERNFYKAKTWGSQSIKTDSVARLNRVPLVLAFNTLTPGPKMIWQFGEIGFDYSIDSFGGRTSNKPSVFSWLSNPLRKSAYDACSRFITMRKTYATAFTQGTFSLQIGLSDWNLGRRIALTHSDLNMVVLGNFQENVTINSIAGFSKTGTWYELMSGTELKVSNTNMNINLKPGELKIYTDRKIVSGGTIDEEKEISVYPTYTDAKVFIKSKVGIDKIALYDMQGKLLKSVVNESSIDVSDLSTGIYTVSVSTTDQVVVRKIIKK